LPEAEQPAVAKALSKLPEQRWSSCCEFVDAIQSWVPSQKSESMTTTAAPEKPERRRPVLLLAGLACIVLLIGLALFQLTRGKEGQPNVVLGPKPKPNPSNPLTKAFQKDSPKEKLVEDNSPDKYAAFVFDGKSRILTKLARFAPVTLEAWVWLDSPSTGRWERTIIGSDIPTKSGISMGLDYSNDWKKAPLLGTQILPGTRRDVGTKQRIPLREWSHLAAVFGATETIIFYNGKLVGQGPPSGNVGGTMFVVGNAGEQNPDHYFVGKMRCVRISKGERYKREFTPPESFRLRPFPNLEGLPPDNDVLLIFDASETKGSRGLDICGMGYDGVMEGVTVIQPQAEKQREPPKNQNTQDKELPNSRPPEKSNSPDREVAKWVLRLNGQVRVVLAGKRKETNQLISRSKDLPTTDFSIYGVTIQNTRISDSDLLKLRPFHIENLVLRYTGISDGGIENLVKDNNNLVDLWRFDLEGTRITDKSFQYLKTLPNLTDLVFIGTGVTEDGVRFIRKALPKCGLHWGRPLPKERYYGQVK
jgi:hypothetical protein